MASPHRLTILTVFLAIPLTPTLALFGQQRPQTQTLEQRLLSEPADELASAAIREGDASRGAIVFYQPFMACRKCHNTDDPTQLLGPDLSRWPEPVSDKQLVNAVLRPSESIRKGYESLSLLTADGRTAVGLIVDRGDPIVLRDPSRPGKRLEFPRKELDAISENKNSLMPSALVDQLSSRQQFLDLVRYLIEIRDGGPVAARNLKPAPHLYAARPLPEYEKNIDHAGMITTLEKENFQRGREIYQRLCVNCHGTPEQPGSLPTSLRFASGQFKSGSDPYTMYQTLTRGFGMMQPQTWMVPQQKYDVIHFIREAYLKPHNPTQYFDVTSEWLTSLPSGDSRGPSPQKLEPWLTMDYGRTLINTYEIGTDGENFAHKGIAVRLDSGPGGVSRGRHWMIFDHDTLRMAAAWSGDQFIDWKGIHFNGQHAIHPRIVGQLQAKNKTGPGWADPETGSWQDSRVLGRDGRQYGPLPRDWAHYEGMYYHGDQTVISYRVGETSVLESPALLTDSPTPVYARHMQLGPRSDDLTLQVSELDLPSAKLQTIGSNAVMLGPESSASSESNTTASRKPLRFGGKQHVRIEDGDAFDMTDSSFSITARIKTKQGGGLFAQTADEDEWVPDGKVWFVRGGRLGYDIGWVGAVESRKRVDDGQWHDVALTWDSDSGIASLWIDGRREGTRELRPKGNLDDSVIRIGYCAENFPRPQSHFIGQIESLTFFDRLLPPESISDEKSSENASARWVFSQTGAEGQLDSAKTITNQVADRNHGSVVIGSASPAANRFLVAGVLGDSEGLRWTQDGGRLRLTIPKGEQPIAVTVWMSAVDAAGQVAETQAAETLSAVESLAYEPPQLERRLAGAKPRLPQVVTTTPQRDNDDGPFAVDVLTRPTSNPWLARVRLTGFDFFPDGDSAAVCSWDGDVWIVTGIDSLGSQLKWRRIATGLFQPLGVRIVDEVIYVTCRDQIAILRDVNGDEEIDFYENFNNDHQVTEHFHEFAMGLQTDEEGNFYYAKSARHALKAVVPHHGTLLRVSKNGERTDIIATGFRAANGVCLNDDGTFIVTDQEGHWNPKNRINWVREGGFYGNMFGYHDVVDSSDEAMEPPLCWITNDFDRSPAELLWVPKNCWGPLGGSLLNLSYGYGKIFVVPHEEVDGQMQGGMCELPMPQFPTGLVRGRFHPTNGHLYTCGMFAWAGNQQQPGGFYRIRFTGQPMHVPLTLSARTGRVQIRFSDSLSRVAAEDPENYVVQAWDLKRTANYGSKHFNQRTWPVTRATLGEDGQTVTLEIPEVAPTWGMEIRCFLESATGQPIERRIHNTIHSLQD